MTEKLLKLSSSVSTTNMLQFDNKFKLKKYSTIHHIIEEFYHIRFNAYKTKKETMDQQSLVAASLSVDYIFSKSR